nr:MAG TPA: hypothetical protein [Caudoviricetes sp.]
MVWGAGFFSRFRYRRLRYRSGTPISIPPVAIPFGHPYFDTAGCDTVRAPVW